MADILAFEVTILLFISSSAANSLPTPAIESLKKSSHSVQLPTIFFINPSLVSPIKVSSKSCQASDRLLIFPFKVSIAIALLPDAASPILMINLSITSVVIVPFVDISASCAAFFPVTSPNSFMTGTPRSIRTFMSSICSLPLEWACPNCMAIEVNVS